MDKEPSCAQELNCELSEMEGYVIGSSGRILYCIVTRLL